MKAPDRSTVLRAKKMSPSRRQAHDRVVDDGVPDLERARRTLEGDRHLLEVGELRVDGLPGPGGGLAAAS